MLVPCLSQVQEALAMLVTLFGKGVGRKRGIMSGRVLPLPSMGWGPKKPFLGFSFELGT